MRFYLLYVLASLAGIAQAASISSFLVSGPELRKNDEIRDENAKLQGFAAAGELFRDADTGALSKLSLSPHSQPAVHRDGVAAEASRIIRLYAAAMQLGGDDIQPAQNAEVMLNSNKLMMSFRRYRSGRRIDGASVQVLFARHENSFWKVMQLRNRAYDGPHTKDYQGWDENELRASLSEENFAILDRESIWWPQESSGRLLLEPVTKFVIQTQAGESYAVIANDRTRGLIQAYSLRISSEMAIRGDVYARSYLDDSRQAYPLKATTVGFDDTEMATGRDGMLDVLGDQAALRLTSPIVAVYENRSNQPYEIGGVSFAESGDVSSEGDDLAALNAYVAIQRIDEFVRGYISPSESAILNNQMIVRVNFSAPGFRNCNAFYEGIAPVGRISLLEDGGGCANMALVNDVIFHEWGHGLDNWTGQSLGIPDGAFSEGIGDILAAYYVGSPNMGEGFFQGQTAGIRPMNNDRRFPEDQGAVHEEGRIIGGTFWDLRTLLIDRYGSARGQEIANTYFLRHLLVADSYLESYDLVLALDDDDGDPMTRSPNHCLINAAFARHGLADELSCDDQIDNLLPVLPLEAALVSVAGSSHLAISATKGDLVFACLNSESENCDERVDFDYDGYTGERFVFVTREPLPTRELLGLTVFVKEGQQTLGRRPFKLFQR